MGQSARHCLEDEILENLKAAGKDVLDATKKKVHNAKIANSYLRNIDDDWLWAIYIYTLSAVGGRYIYKEINTGLREFKMEVANQWAVLIVCLIKGLSQLAYEQKKAGKNKGDGSNQ